MRVIFKKHLLSQSYSRPAAIANADGSEVLTIACPDCESELRFSVNDLMSAAYAWREQFGVDAEIISAEFNMNIVGKTPDGGLTSVIELQCGVCGTRYLVYAGAEETSNSAYRATIQGVAEVSYE